MQLRIDAPTPAHADELLAFETRNRAWFESIINGREPSYYTDAGVREAIAQAVEDRANDRGYQFLVREDGRLVGRVNLHHVRRRHFDSAELGYRVDRAENGRGIATRAVALCLAEAFGSLGLRRVEAVAQVGNLASIRVLERSGFTRYGLSRKSFELAGTWHDRAHFECHRSEAGA
jgi:ribosomal-protein-alanine N-acetyltransferase